MKHRDYIYGAIIAFITGQSIQLHTIDRKIQRIHGQIQ